MKNAIHTREYGLDVIYRHDYDKEQNAENISQYIEKSCKYLDKFLGNVPQSFTYKTLWDIGCGNTQVLNWFQDKALHRLDGYGIDLFPQEDDPRIRRWDFHNLKKCYDESIPKPDVVFINHTLEHSLAPVLMNQVREFHKMGGVIFIAVPDADYPWSYEITSSTTHWSIFNEGFLRTLLSRYGYECVVEKKCFRENCGELFAVGIKRW